MFDKFVVFTIQAMAKRFRINIDAYRPVAISLAALLSFCVQAFSQPDWSKYFPKQTDFKAKLPRKENVWIFILAGQSNMAGRGFVEPQDTMPNSRILTINAANQIIIAKEPLHFYEPNLTGLDCGHSFANRLLRNLNKEITILLLPVAVGGSSSQQWLGDSLHRNVRLMSNFKKKVEAMRDYGIVKGILWHQGESDADTGNIAGYQGRLEKIFNEFRSYCGNTNIPILIGELGSFSENQAQWNLVNEAIHQYGATDKNSIVISTSDLKPKADKIHFNSEGQRLMGSRMAEKFLEFSKL